MLEWFKKIGEFLNEFKLDVYSISILVMGIYGFFCDSIIRIWLEYKLKISRKYIYIKKDYISLLKAFVIIIMMIVNIYYIITQSTIFDRYNNGNYGLIVALVYMIEIYIIGYIVIEEQVRKNKLVIFIPFYLETIFFISNSKYNYNSYFSYDDIVFIAIQTGLLLLFISLLYKSGDELKNEKDKFSMTIKKICEFKIVKRIYENQLGYLLLYCLFLLSIFVIRIFSDNYWKAIIIVFKYINCGIYIILLVLFFIKEFSLKNLIKKFIKCIECGGVKYLVLGYNNDIYYLIRINYEDGILILDKSEISAKRIDDYKIIEKEFNKVKIV